mmetsp:Transcript_2941/g.7490  ORF Transcript_2941/g.7490 Transcript_2941/m.7490 type:complete len:230 (+) Transcript_2941:622-1311(+)
MSYNWHSSASESMRHSRGMFRGADSKAAKGMHAKSSLFSFSAALAAYSCSGSMLAIFTKKTSSPASLTQTAFFARSSRRASPTLICSESVMVPEPGWTLGTATAIPPPAHRSWGMHLLLQATERPAATAPASTAADTLASLLASLFGCRREVGASHLASVLLLGTAALNASLIGLAAAGFINAAIQTLTGCQRRADLRYAQEQRWELDGVAEGFSLRESFTGQLHWARG